MFLSPYIVRVYCLLYYLLLNIIVICLLVSAVVKTERLEKHIHNVDLQTKVTYQLQDAKLLQVQ